MRVGVRFGGPSDEPSPYAIGDLLRSWRQRRRISQLDLAGEANISARHLSFLENGRARPSREMILTLARTLEVPVRGRNELLLAAGFAPVYRERSLDAAALTPVRRALELMLAKQEPFPAIVLDRLWNIVMANGAMTRLTDLFLRPDQAAAAGAPNMMELTYHPEGLRQWIVNWEETASAYIQWLHRDLLRSADDEVAALLERILSFPGVPRHWLEFDLDNSPAPFLTIELQRDDVHLSFFTTAANLGTPYDITLHEVRIESFFPADDATDVAMKRLACG